MSDYDGLDDATLQEMLNGATDYEERSAIRKAIRQRKKERGQQVGRPRPRGASLYSRFVGGTAPSKSPTPINYIKTASTETDRKPSPQRTPPPRTEARSDSRTSNTPSRGSDHEAPIWHHSPTPPPQEEPDSIPPHTEPEIPISPPPSPPPKEEPEESPPPSPEPTQELEETEEPPGPTAEEEVDAGVEEQEEEEEEEEPVQPEPEEPVQPEPVQPEPVPKQEERGVGRLREKAPGSPRRRDEPDTGSPRWGSVTLRSRESQAPQPQVSRSGEEPKPEFQGFRLRRTLREKEREEKRKGGPPESKFNFGVKLKSKESPPAPAATTESLPSQREREEETSTRQRAKTLGSPRHKEAAPKGPGPRTLRDYQEISAKSRRVRSPEESGEVQPCPTDKLHKYLVAYVNRELSLHPPLPVRGKALFDTCSNPSMLCKLINKSVKNTVDLRALTRIPPSASARERTEALQENMTLTTESARAIGCRVTDFTGDRILEKDPETIRDFLVDIIRARVVNMPGMDEEPSSTFTNLPTLFSKLNITVEGEEETDQPKESPVSWREEDGERFQEAIRTPPSPSTPERSSWREKPSPSTPERSSRREKPSSPPPKVDVEKPAVDTTELSYKERAAVRKAEREKRMRERAAAGGPSVDTSLSYEERSVLRKAEREKRRREREALATAK